MSLGNISTHISILPWEQKEDGGYRRSIVRLKGDLSWVKANTGTVYLFNSWLVRVQQRSGFHVFRDEFAADAGHFLPVIQHGQSKVLICLLLQT